jgi:hypothetical protein
MKAEPSGMMLAQAVSRAIGDPDAFSHPLANQDCQSWSRPSAQPLHGDDWSNLIPATDSVFFGTTALSPFGLSFRLTMGGLFLCKTYRRRRPPQPEKRLSQKMSFQKGKPSVFQVAADTVRHDGGRGTKARLRRLFGRSRKGRNGAASYKAKGERL